MNLLFLGGGLWIIPSLTLIGALIFLYQAYKASKSGSIVQPDSTKPAYESDENVPIYKVPRFYFAAALFIITVVIFLMMRSDR